MCLKFFNTKETVYVTRWKYKTNITYSLFILYLINKMRNSNQYKKNGIIMGYIFFFTSENFMICVLATNKLNLHH